MACCSAACRWVFTNLSCANVTGSSARARHEAATVPCGCAKNSILNYFILEITHFVKINVYILLQPKWDNDFKHNTRTNISVFNKYSILKKYIELRNLSIINNEEVESWVSDLWDVV